MKLRVKVLFKEGYEGAEEFECTDWPSMGDWITLYLANYRQVSFPKDSVSKVESWIE